MPEPGVAPLELTPPPVAVQRSGGAAGWTRLGVTVCARTPLEGVGRAPLVIGGLIRLTSESAFVDWMAWRPVYVGVPALPDPVELVAVPQAVSTAMEIRIAGSRLTVLL